MLVQVHSPNASIPLPNNGVSYFNFCAFDLLGRYEDMV